MPSSATITSFYNFSPNTRARATQVNTNFDNFRGHLIPIEPLTATSSNITYDLGSDEHRWRDAYLKSVDFDRSTSTASSTIESDSNTNTGEMIFKNNGTERFRINGVGFKGVNASTFGVTTSAVMSQLAARVVPSYATTPAAATYQIPGSTITIQTIGRPIEFGFCKSGNTSASGSFSSTNGYPMIIFNGSTLLHYEINGYARFIRTENSGTYNIHLEAKVNAGGNLIVNDILVYAREIY